LIELSCRRLALILLSSSELSRRHSKHALGVVEQVLLADLAHDTAMSADPDRVP